VDSLNLGDAVNGSFQFAYTFANTDNYEITGTYSASEARGAGTSIGFVVNAFYLGNSTNTASANDVLRVDLLQNYLYPYALDGTYFASAGGSLDPSVAPGSSFKAELTYNGQSVGVIGPFSGPGFQSGSTSATLTGLTNPLAADFSYTYDFAAGSTPTPEPTALALSAAGLLAVGVFKIRRRRVVRTSV
jgi:hypothetical protein